MRACLKRSKNTSSLIPPRTPEILGWKGVNERGYHINEEPSGLLREIKVVVLGAGASGINWAKLVDDELENVELKIFEKNSDVGGTWLENRYP